MPRLYVSNGTLMDESCCTGGWKRDDFGCVAQMMWQWPTTWRSAWATPRSIKSRAPQKQPRANALSLSAYTYVSSSSVFFSPHMSRPNQKCQVPIRKHTIPPIGKSARAHTCTHTHSHIHTYAQTWSLVAKSPSKCPFPFWIVLVGKSPIEWQILIGKEPYGLIGKSSTKCQVSLWKNPHHDYLKKPHRPC